MNIKNNFEIWTIYNLYKKFNYLKINFIFIFILILLESITSSISLTFFIPVIDSIFNSKNDIWIYDYLPINLIESPGKTVLFFGIILLIKSIFSFLRFLYLVYFTELLRKKWQVLFFKSQINLKYRDINDIPRGKIIDNVNRLPDLSSMFILNFMTYLARLSIIFFVLISIFLINYKYALILISVFVILFFLFGKKYFTLSLKFGKKSVELNQDLTSEVSNSINGIKDLLILNAQKFKINAVEIIAKKTARLRILTKIFASLPKNILEVFLALVMIFISIILLISEIDFNQYLSIITFISGSVYIVISNIITASSERYKVIVKKYAFHLLINELSNLKTYHEEVNKSNLEQISNIKFDYVNFKYEKKNNDNTSKFNEIFFLKDLNFTIKINECTALVGPSGSGKSTLIDLLIKLHQPNSGKILYGNKDIGKINTIAWREKISYVAQEPYFFNGTIKDNILIGKSGISDFKIEECCKIAEIHDFISKLSDGYNSNINDAGNNISGGQKRRIAIARALVNKPLLIIIDEATSSISENLEEKIINSLKKIDNLGILIISHRSNLNSFVDKIYEIGNSTVKQIKF
ncbi:ABC transporter ATP-binding protein [Alphaproteobacteria bacterium]|nr:ABC transporter ATP-binding protein [Alphaproteobacteria bacterium]